MRRDLVSCPHALCPPWRTRLLICLPTHTHMHTFLWAATRSLVQTNLLRPPESMQRKIYSPLRLLLKYVGVDVANKKVVGSRNKHCTRAQTICNCLIKFLHTIHHEVPHCPPHLSTYITYTYINFDFDFHFPVTFLHIACQSMPEKLYILSSISPIHQFASTPFSYCIVCVGVGGGEPWIDCCSALFYYTFLSIAFRHYLIKSLFYENMLCNWINLICSSTYSTTAISRLWNGFQLDPLPILRQKSN